MTGQQGSFDDLGIPLHEVTFVVVDLETTGGSPVDDAITEIGAVKVRGGEVLGEFQTLVDPCRPIPPAITALTGLTDSAVRGAPRIGAVLPAFLDFAAGATLVAHNAPFDIGFLRAAAAAEHLSWPTLPVVDTVKVARALTSRDEMPNLRLATLAGRLGSPVTPTHRALDDARATSHVLHALLERGGRLGVHHLDDLAGLGPRVADPIRRKTRLADGLPDSPGVYLFRDDADRVLYVGTSRSLRTRVRSYFTASEQRAGIRRMLPLIHSVTSVPCPTAIEARIREVRLIAEHSPPFNRRSRSPGRAAWVRLTDERFPRLSIVRAPRGDDASIGPFSSRLDAELAIEALHDAFALRRCTQRITRHASGPACVLLDLGRCAAPCLGRQDADDYARIVADVRHAMLVDPAAVLEAGRQRLQHLADEQRYEQAARQRDRVAAFVRAAARSQRMRALAECPEIAVAAPSEARTPQPAWDLVVVRHGRLAGSATVAHGPRLLPALDALRSTAARVLPDGSGLPVGHIDETLALLAWLDRPGVRLAAVDGVWTLPVGSAARAAVDYAWPRVRATHRSSSAAAAPLSIAAAARMRA